MKCLICERRPARTPEGYCANCAAQVGERKKNGGEREPVKFLTYRGDVVGLYPNGNGKLRAKLLKRSPETLPKNKTLDLNIYLPGFDRSQIKRFKACVLQLAHA